MAENESEGESSVSEEAVQEKKVPEKPSPKKIENPAVEKAGSKAAVSKPGFFSNATAAIRNDYLTNYRRNCFIVFVFALLLLGGIAFNYFRHGELFRKDISLQGGVSITISRGDLDRTAMLNALSKDYPKSDINVRELQSVGVNTGIVIESSDLSEQQIIPSINSNFENLHLTASDYTVQMMSATLGQAFFRQTIFSVLIAFGLMALTVFIYFRIPIPSFFVVLCAFLDVIGTVFVISLSNMRISSAGISALLVLIGYSVTTDILLTARALHGRYATLNENIMLALRTGMNMTLTTIAALLAAYVFAESELIKQIMLIMIIGLCFDMVFTWFMNVGILRIYLDRRESAQKAKHNQN